MVYDTEIRPILDFFMTQHLLAIALGISILMTGCGKYGKPLPPEVLAPTPVKEAIVTASDAGVNFDWGSPTHDTRGKELKSMNGYRLYRKSIVAQKDIIDDSVSFDLITTIVDEHVNVREKLRAEARAEGKPGRRITAPKSYQHFNFTDKSVALGQSYLYKIVPFNQGDVESENPDLFLVVFSGASSHISTVEPDSSGNLDPGDIQ